MAKPRAFPKGAGPPIDMSLRPPVRASQLWSPGGRSLTQGPSVITAFARNSLGHVHIAHSLARLEEFLEEDRHPAACYCMSAGLKASRFAL